MNKIFLIKFAYRNLKSHLLRSILTLTGIAIGISAIVFLVSFGFGIERLVTREITAGDAFKLIDVGTGESQIIKLNSGALDQLNKISGIEKVETISNLAAKVKFGNKTTDIAFYGTSDQYMSWSGLYIKDGRSLNGASGNEIVVNTAFSKFLEVDKPEDAIGLEVFVDIILDKDISDLPDAKVVENQKFKIIGIIQNESATSAYVNSSTVAEFGVNNLTQARIEATSREAVSNIRSNIENMGYKTQYVGDTIAQIEQIFSIFKVILGSFGLVALIVASLGMFNTLTISLLERMKEVALLKILGMKRKDISWLFLSESIIFGFFGGIIGIFCGYAVSQIINFVLNLYIVRSGGDQVSVFYLPLTFIFVVTVFSFVIGLLTGIYPSRRATKIAPLDVIRYE